MFEIKLARPDQVVTLLEVADTVQMRDSSQIALHLAQSEVSGYARDGENLIVTLEDGQELVIAGFFGTVEPAQLFLSKDGEIDEVILEQTAALEISGASYVPVSSEAQVGYLIFEDSTLLADVAGMGVIAGVAGLAALAVGTGGSVDSSFEPEIGAAEPEELTFLVLRDDEISGTGEPGARILIDLDGDGTADITTNVDETGHWTVTPEDPIAAGTAVSVTAVGVDGEVSESVELIVPDTSAPAAPVIETANGTEISGTAEAGSTVEVVVGGETYSVVASDPGGLWSVSPEAPDTFDTGETITVEATDAQGNTSAATTETVDATAPTEPVISIANGSEISGIAEAGSTVEVMIGGETYSVVASDPDGLWSVSPAAPDTFDTGETITVEATDAQGNTSVTTTETVDATAPGEPVVSIANGNEISGTAEAGSTVEVVVGGETYSVVASDPDGLWSVSPEAPDTFDTGETITVEATDAQGNTSATTTETVDATAPGEPVVSIANGNEISGTAEAGSTVEIVVGGETYSVVASDPDGLWSVSPEAPDTFDTGEAITVEATDAQGNTSEQATATVDATAPGAPVVETNNGTEVSGTAEAGSTVEVEIGGETYTTVANDPDGTWSVSPVAPNTFDTGEAITAEATDAQGNTSAQATATVDATAPDAPVISLSNGTEVSGTAEAGSTVEVVIGGETYSVVASDPDGLWSVSPEAPDTFDTGETITVEATDAQGNTSAQATATVDATAPDAPVISLSNGTEVSGTAEAGSTVEVVIGGETYSVVASDPDGLWSVSPEAPDTFDTGETITVEATDAQGNTSEQATATVDATAPGAPVVETNNGTEVSGTAEAGSTVEVVIGGETYNVVASDPDGLWSVSPEAPDTFDTGETITVEATDAQGNTSEQATAIVDATAPGAPVIETNNGTEISGTAEAGSTVEVVVGGETYSAVASDPDGLWSVSPLAPDTFDTGDAITAEATDAQGNTSAQATATVDATAPDAPVISLSNGTEVSGTAEAGSTVEVVIGGETYNVVASDPDGLWSVSPEAPDTFHTGETITVEATDAQGNTSEQATAIVDATAPGAPVIETNNGTEISGTAEAGSTVEVVVGGETYSAVASDPDGLWSVSPLAPDTFDTGDAITAEATDAQGNTSAQATATVDATAPDAPVISLSNGTEASGTAEAGSTVEVVIGGETYNVVASDPDGLWSVSPEAPDTFHTGETITVEATDAQGNTSEQATAIVDATAPGAPVVETNNGTEVSGTAEAGSTVEVVIGGETYSVVASDPDGLWSVSPEAPDTFDTGEAITVEATDAQGNTSEQATATVDATAPGAPVIETNNGTEISGTAEAGSTVEVVVGGETYSAVASDPDGLWSVSPLAPDTFDTGDDITAEATDAQGNTSAQATATVDATAPGTPVISLFNGTEVSGTAEAGSTVEVVIGSETYSVVASDPDGLWSVSPLAPDTFDTGEVITAEATDAQGNTSAQATATVDATAPGTPVISLFNGTEVSGTAEAGSTVEVVIGSETYSVVASDPDGLWSVSPLAPDTFDTGEVITAEATDAQDNTSAQATATVDATAPDAPVISLSNGTEVSGTAEAGSIVEVVVGGETYSVVASDPDGLWSVSPQAPDAFDTGEAITAEATDAQGNTSAQTTATVDATAPGTPVIDTTNGTEVSGTAEAGSTVEVVIGGETYSVVASDPDGLWSVSPLAPDTFDTGEAITAEATDAQGNTSAQATTTVDATAPDAPVISLFNGTEVSGTAEAGSTVEVVIGGETYITVANDPDGTWSVSPLAPDTFDTGEAITAEATDAQGNTSAQATATVDATAPDAPVISLSNGTEVSGTAEAGSTVEVVIGGETYTTVANDPDGLWSVSPVAPDTFDSGETVTAEATDAQGNTSAQATATVDATAPDAPVIGLASGTEVSGTAEAGSTVDVVIGGETYSVVASDPDGLWSVSPLAPDTFDTGEAITAEATDAQGNTSAQATATVDATAPDAPVITLASGTEITGTAEANAQIAIDIDGDGVTDLSGQADGNGDFTIALPQPIEAPTVPYISEIAYVGSGEASGEFLEIVLPNGVDPALFVVGLYTSSGALSNSASSFFPGQGEITLQEILDEVGSAPGSLATGVAGGVDLAVSVDPVSGFLVLTLPAASSWPDVTDSNNASGITLTQLDSAGATSGTVLQALDVDTGASSLASPTEGVAAGASYTVVEGGGAATSSVQIDNEGVVSYEAVTPGSVSFAGFAAVATATDATGNVSDPSNGVDIDYLPPAITINPLVTGLDTVISGTGEPNTLTELFDSNGDSLGTTTTAGDGSFSLTPSTPLAEGDSVSASQTDAVGNVGTSEVTVSLDTDSDTVADVIDIDDDNDGVIDFIENVDVQQAISDSSNTGTLVSGGQTVNLSVTTSGNASLQGPQYDGFVASENGLGTVTTTFSSPVTDLSIEFYAVISSTSIGNFSVTLADGTVLTNLDFEIAPELTSTFAGTKDVVVQQTRPDGTFEIVDPDGGGGTDQAGGTLTFPDLVAAEVAAGGGVESFSFDVIEGGGGGAAVFIINGSANGNPDADADGVGNRFDTDADDGGISDTEEAQFGSAAPIVASGVDSDGNGLDDAFESAPGAGEGLIPADSDGDGTTDMFQTDAGGVDEIPGPTVNPLVTGLDTVVTGSGLPNVMVEFFDEASVSLGTTTSDATGAFSFTPSSALADGAAITAVQTDSAGFSGTTTETVSLDTDSDTVADVIDIDDDNDGILDTQEYVVDVQQATVIDATTATLASAGDTIGLAVAASDGAVLNPDPYEGRFSYREGASGTITTDFDAPVSDLVFDLVSVYSGNSVGNFTVTLADGTVLSNLDFEIASELHSTSGNTSQLLVEGAHADGRLMAVSPGGQAGGLLTFPGLAADQVAAGGGIESFSFDVIYASTSFAATFAIAASSFDADTDDDGVVNSLDTDSDGGGIDDNLEAQYGVVNLSGDPVTVESSFDQVSTGIIANSAFANSAWSLLDTSHVLFNNNGTLALGPIPEFEGAVQQFATVDGQNYFVDFSASHAAGRPAQVLITIRDENGDIVAQDVSVESETATSEFVSGQPMVFQGNGGDYTVEFQAVGENNGVANISLLTVNETDAGPVALSGVDSDGNGLDDAYESAPGAGEGLAPADTDADQVPDFLETDGTGVDAFPEPVVNLASEVEISGVAEAGTTIEVDVDGDGNADYTTTANAIGNWSVTPSSSLPDGTTVSVTASDASGNTSAPTTTAAYTPPTAAPIVGIADASEISGYAEPGATVTVTADGMDYTAVADANGDWSLSPMPALDEGTALSVVAQLPDGHSVSPVESVSTAQNLVFNGDFSDANGDISGTDNPNGWITTEPDGGVIRMDGGFFAPLGESVAFNRGFAAPTGMIEQTISNVTPGIPVTFAFDTLFNGSGGNPAIRADIVDSVGNIVYSQEVGTVTTTSHEFVPTDSEYTIRFTDVSTGNLIRHDLHIDNVSLVSQGGSDILPPEVASAEGTDVSGTGVPGTTVSLVVDGGAAIEVPVDANGDWAATLSSEIDESTVIEITATDLAGNVSAPVIAGVDTDSDGVINAFDIDDDNDGILDTDEIGNHLPADGFSDGVWVNNGLALVDGVATWTNNVNNPAAPDGSLTRSVSGMDTLPTIEVDGVEYVQINYDFRPELANNTNNVTMDVVINGTTVQRIFVPHGNQHDAVLASGNVVHNGAMLTENSATELPNNEFSTIELLVPASLVTGDTMNIAFNVINNNGGNLPRNDFSITEPVVVDVDVDRDGTVNRLDTDSDDGGVGDNIEAQYGETYIAPSGVDDDGNGLDDAYESAPGAGEGLTLADTNADGVPDFLEDTVPDTQSFGYTGADQTFIVPEGVTSIDVSAWGAGGGDSGLNSTRDSGGAGAFTGATIAVNAGDVITVVVGQAGEARDTDAQYGGGGAGGNAPDIHDGSSGGGRSAILINGVEVLTAGGGGGAGGATHNGAYSFGGAGGLVAEDSDNSANTYGALAGGKGATTSAGGAGGDSGTGFHVAGDSGTQFMGGAGGDSPNTNRGAGGGGGGGYFGGGGGASQNGTAVWERAGGGGSSYADSSVASNVTHIDGNLTAAPNTTDANYASGVAEGGDNGAAGNGLVVFTYNVSVPSPVIDTASGDTVSGTALPGSTVELTVDGEVQAMTADAVTGAFSFTAVAPDTFEAGEAISVIASNANGDVSPATTGVFGTDTIIDARGIADLETDVVTVTGNTGDFDTLSLDSGANLVLDLTLADNANVTDVERIDITGDSDNTLTLELSDLLDLSSTSDELQVFGNAGDTVNASGFSSTGESRTIDGQTFDVYSSGAGALLVHEDVTVIV